ncbi:MAG: hypothetical protein IIC71_10725 [Acidobacteria bacterium]|nr:hypothetical protein [Acidobacteriota bacterium]
MAAASDGAAPGDILYSIDRVYERLASFVGFDLGGPSERLDEARVMLVRGESDAALMLVSEAVIDTDQMLAGDIEDLAAAIHGPASPSSDPADLEPSVTALVAAAESFVNAAPSGVGIARAELIGRSNDVAVAGGSEWRVPPGHNSGFVPPGQNDEFIPPGQPDGSLPPGQDDDFTPPGQDDDFTPPGQDDDFTPPGQDDDFTPPGQDGGSENSSGGNGNGNEDG